MLYSVPKNDLAYDYWEGSGDAPETSGWWRAPTRGPVNGLYAPEAFMSALPKDAVQRGSGTEALGEITSAPGAMASLASWALPWKSVLTAVGGLLVGWWYGRK